MRASPGQAGVSGRAGREFAAVWTRPSSVYLLAQRALQKTGGNFVTGQLGLLVWVGGWDCPSDGDPYSPVSAADDEAVASIILSNALWGGLTNRTGMPACRTTSSVTLPETSLARPERPWVDIAIRSTPREWAVSMIFTAGAPSTTVYPASIPSAGQLLTNCER